MEYIWREIVRAMGVQFPQTREPKLALENSNYRFESGTVSSYSVNIWTCTVQIRLLGIVIEKGDTVSEQDDQNSCPQELCSGCLKENYKCVLFNGRQDI